MKKLKIFKFIFFLFFALQLSGTVILATLPLVAQAEDNYSSLDYTPQINLPVSGSGLDQATTKVGSYDSASGVMSSDLLARYIKALYDYGMIICGILAAIVLMGGGVLWLTSAGDSSKISQAKELITGSLVGTVILFSSWIILNTINPDLLKMKVITTQIIKKINIVCCQYGQGNKWTGRAELTTDKDCAKNGGEAFTYKTDVLGKVTPYSPNASGKKCSLPVCCIIRDASQKITSCFYGMEDNCTIAPYKGEVHTGDCSYINEEMYADGEVRSCKGRTDHCATAENGDDCFNTSQARPSDSYCYNKVCWLGKGEVGEPCGNELYSKCEVDTPQGGRTCEQDRFGRSCINGENIWCCKFKPNGLRLNN